MLGPSSRSGISGEDAAGDAQHLLSADFPLVLSQSYCFLTRAQAHGRLSMKSSQMASAGDKALSQIEGLAEAETLLRRMNSSWVPITSAWLSIPTI